MIRISRIIFFQYFAKSKLSHFSSLIFTNKVLMFLTKLTKKSIILHHGNPEKVNFAYLITDMFQIRPCRLIVFVSFLWMTWNFTSSLSDVSPERRCTQECWRIREGVSCGFGSVIDLILSLTVDCQSAAKPNVTTTKARNGTRRSARTFLVVGEIRGLFFSAKSTMSGIQAASMNPELPLRSCAFKLIILMSK